jgi:hypothetical protein
LSLHPLQKQLVRVAIYVLLLLGALIYNGYGAPEGWFADELIGLSERLISQGTFDPGSFQYPAGLQIYLSALIYKIWSFIVGAGDLDRGTLIHVARSVSAFFFIATVYFFERAVTELTEAESSLITVILVGTSCALIHHAHIATAQSSAFFALSLSFFAFAKVIVERSRHSYYSACFASGLAVGAKYNTIFIGT